MDPRFVPSAEIDKVEGLWRRWLPQDASLYETPEYARYRFRELAPNYEGGVALVEDNGDPVGLVPYRMQASLAGIPTRDLQTIGLGVAAPGAPALQVPDIAAALGRLRPFRIRVEMRAGAPSWGRSFRGTVPLAGKDGVVPLAESWDAFVEAQSPRLRKHLRHALRAIAKDGWSLVDATERGAEAIERANALRDIDLNHRFPGYGGKYRSAQRDASFAEIFAGRGLAIWELRRGDEVASVLYGVRRAGTFYLVRQGNDPAFFDAFADGVSFTLRAALLERLVPRGVRILDVVGGTEGLWPAVPSGRVAALYEWRAPHASACRAAAAALARQHRAPWFALARRAVARLNPRLAAHAA